MIYDLFLKKTPCFHYRRTCFILSKSIENNTGCACAKDVYNCTFFSDISISALIECRIRVQSEDS